MINGLKENLAGAGVGVGDDRQLEFVITRSVGFVLGASAGCGGALCSLHRQSDRARLLMNGHALGQSLFGSTYIHTHYITLHP